MTIRLSSELEQLIRKRAEERHTTPEAIVVEALREYFSPHACERSSPPQVPSDWNEMLEGLAIHYCSHRSQLL